MQSCDARCVATARPIRFTWRHIAHSVDYELRGNQKINQLWSVEVLINILRLSRSWPRTLEARRLGSGGQRELLRSRSMQWRVTGITISRSGVLCVLAVLDDLTNQIPNDTTH